MKNLLTASQTRAADAYTIANLPIASIDLMEKAAKAFVKVFVKEVKPKQSIAIFCGQGNNGGDGLAIARLLWDLGYHQLNVYLIQFSNKKSEDFQKNLKRLKQTPVPIYKVKRAKDVPTITDKVIVDAILGSGLNQPLTGEYELLVKQINDAAARVIAVDVPSGFFCEGPIVNYNGVRADLAICFQTPKLNFYFPESTAALADFKVVAIGLDKDFIATQSCQFKLITPKYIRQSLKPREKFTHKGTYGHALLLAGNTKTMGAAILAASACLHAGAGLTTVCLPQSGLTALNVALPEAMALPRQSNLTAADFMAFTALAIGPGLGTEPESETLMTMLIDLQKPMVLDADALTILSKNQALLRQIKTNTILTPHVKEFDRLFGEHHNWWDRIATAQQQAQQLNIIIVLKNQYTFVCLPTGDVCINPTGNPAMSSGGMGDVLTGLIVSLLAQGYSPEDAAILGVYLHGKAGDELAKKQFSLTASQIASYIPFLIKKIIA